MFLALAACAPKEDVGGGAKAGGQISSIAPKDGNKTAEFFLSSSHFGSS